MCIVLINTAHLLATVAWQIEDQHREKRDAHTRYYKVDSVKQSLPSHGDVERDVEVGLVAARVKFFISANETLDVTVFLKIPRVTSRRIVILKLFSQHVRHFVLLRTAGYVRRNFLSLIILSFRLVFRQRIASFSRIGSNWRSTWKRGLGGLGERLGRFLGNVLPHGWDFEDIPLDGSVKLRQIDADIYDVAATDLVDVP